MDVSVNEKYALRDRFPASEAGSKLDAFFSQIQEPVFAIKLHRI